ncbi:MAG TPA: protein-arginine deiminase family protein [Candidatus Ozemobacteraceae bacterium]|nr:protein-arginine deiminase family protein [Candidatus Ozemobacteraceae bacterium]
MNGNGGWKIVTSLVAILLLAGNVWAGTIRLMSANQLPRKVLVVNHADTTGFVKELFRVIRDIHENDGLTGADAFKLHIVDSAGRLSSRDARASFFEAPSGVVEKLVEINPDVRTNDIWMQDFGELCIWSDAASAGPAVFDSAREAGLKDFPEWVAKNWNLKLCVNPSSTAGFGDGDSGGNIEVTPDNILYHGDSMTPECREFFRKNGYDGRTIMLATKWLAVGHIDEYLSIVPTRYSPCGYAIVRAAPCGALDLLGKASGGDFEALPEPFASFLPKLRSALLAPDAWKGTAEAKFIELNRKINGIIDENTDKLVAEIRRITGDAHREVPVVSWPVLFKGNEAAPHGHCIAYTPDVVNHLILRDHLIVSDPLFSPFRNLIQDSAANLGCSIHFLNAAAYHDRKGDVHCATNVLRDPDRAFLTAPDQASLAALRSRFDLIHREPPNL